MTGQESLNDLIEDLQQDNGVSIICKEKVEKSLKALEIIKPLCEVVETPVKKFRYLKINGVVVYTFKTEEEFNLLKEVEE